MPGRLIPPAPLAALPNGSPTTPTATTSDKPSFSKGLAQLLRQMPSDAPDLIHMTDGYQPLSKLFHRAAQDCFNSLNNTISHSTQPPRSPKVNGNSPRLDSHDPSAADSTAQRLRWLGFANTNRERFIKLLVLLQWSRQSRHDIGRLVDVFAFMRRIHDSYDALEDELGSFKRDLSPYKVPRPDIQTALETLTTGQSSRLLELDYIPRPPISAAQTLQTIQNINSILHIRLNVHEDLPISLRNFQIDSGRVTFTVGHEFAMDLSIYDEDPTSPFYFVDFRFLFSPCSEIPTGQLRSELEHRSNAVLASEGLTACYDLFHDFVLTYKLSVLRRQALQLMRGAWADTLRVQRVHRSLILHYWTASSQKKSWLEIGVNGGKNESSSRPWRNDRQSSLFVKWVRAGETESAADLPSLDTQNLDVEQLLKRVVKLHTEYILCSVQEKINEQHSVHAGTHPPYLTTSDMDEFSSVVLAIPMYHNATTSMLGVEPISGKFSIYPKTVSSAKCEDRLSSLRQPVQEILARLLAWRSHDGAEQLRSSASCFGWQIVRSVQLDAPTRKECFGDESGSLSLLKRWNDTEWFVAAMPNPQLEYSFWAVRIVKAPPTLWSSEGLEVRQSYKLDHGIRELSVQSFTHLYQWSVATISSHIVRQSLTDLNVKFAPQSSKTKIKSDPFHPLLLDLSHDLGPPKIAKNLILCHDGLELKSERGHGKVESAVLHSLKGQFNISHGSKNSPSLVQAPDVRFWQDGTFAILNRSVVGATEVADELLDRLKHVVLLQLCLESLKRREFEVVSASLKSLKFRYAEAPTKLEAQVEWSEQGSISLTLLPESSNPHMRLYEPLQQLLQPGSALKSSTTLMAAEHFNGFALALSDTLELVRGFDKIEAQGGVIVQAGGVDKYEMEYDLPRCNVQLIYKRSQGRGWWYFGQTEKSPRNNTKLQESIKEMVSKSSAGVMAPVPGATCDTQTTGEFVQRLDEAIRSCGDAEERKPREPRKKREGAGTSSSITAGAGATAQSEDRSKTADKATANTAGQGQGQNKGKEQQTAKEGAAQPPGGNKTQASAGNSSGKASNGVRWQKPEVVVVED